MIFQLTIGCAALQERATSFLKDQAVKVIVKELDRLEARFEEKVKESGLEIAKLKEAATNIHLLIRGGLPEGKNVFGVFGESFGAVKDQQQNMQWYGVAALFLYLLKQMGWSALARRREEKLVDKITNGHSSPVPPST